MIDLVKSSYTRLQMFWNTKMNKQAWFIMAAYFMICFCLAFLLLTGYAIHYSPKYKDNDVLVADFAEHSWYGWLEIGVYVLGWYIACFFLCGVFEEKMKYVVAWSIYFLLFTLLHTGTLGWRIFLMVVEKSRNPTFIILECVKIAVGAVFLFLGHLCIQQLKNLARLRNVISRPFIK